VDADVDGLTQVLAADWRRSAPEGFMSKRQAARCAIPLTTAGSPVS